MNPKSTKGHATKARILEAAIKLIYERGANGTSVDDILKASGTGKSQFYHYFKNKDHLLNEVVRSQSRNFPGKNLADFNFTTPEGINAWMASIRKDFVAGNYKHGCPIGNLASELATTSADLRAAISGLFISWETELSRGLKLQKARGLIKLSSDPSQIAAFIMSAVEGALLLAKTHDSVIYLDASISQIGQFLKLNATTTLGRSHLPRPTTLGFCP